MLTGRLRRLADARPDVLATWDATRNGDDGQAVVVGSRRRVWWICPEHPHHQWRESVVARCRSGCSYCSGSRSSPADSLAAKDPELSAQWHPRDNGDTSPSDLSVRSSQTVSWLCPDGHTWQSPIWNRRDLSCPHCWRAQVDH